ncbi:MAG: hypothetical protein AVDCRST_MAG20-837, partial [uncultured Acidimicrobiales bacterium]
GQQQGRGPQGTHQGGRRRPHRRQGHGARGQDRPGLGRREGQGQRRGRQGQGRLQEV